MLQATTGQATCLAITLRMVSGGGVSEERSWGKINGETYRHHSHRSFDEQHGTSEIRILLRSSRKHPAGDLTKFPPNMVAQPLQSRQIIWFPLTSAA
jgi:hypothetical protein